MLLPYLHPQKPPSTFTNLAIIIFFIHEGLEVSIKVLLAVEDCFEVGSRWREQACHFLTLLSEGPFFIVLLSFEDVYIPVVFLIRSLLGSRRLIRGQDSNLAFVRQEKEIILKFFVIADDPGSRRVH